MKSLRFGAIALMTLLVREPPVYWGNATSENGEVCLDLPADLVDWRGLAIKTLGKQRFEHPRPGVLHLGLGSEAGNSIDLKFQAQVPPAVSRRQWSVFFRGGAKAVTPTVLRGTVTYVFDSTLSLTQAPVATGTACAIGQTPASAAFFVSGATVHDAEPYEGGVAPAGKDSFAIEVGGRSYRFARPGFAFPKVLHVTLFHMDSAETVALVEWDPEDGSNCASSFTLITLAPAGKRPPMENGYDCDV